MDCRRAYVLAWICLIGGLMICLKMADSPSFIYFLGDNLIPLLICGYSIYAIFGKPE